MTPIHPRSKARNANLTALSVAVLLLVLVAMAVSTYRGLSARAFGVGSNLVIGPGFTGRVQVAPGCIADAQRGRVAVPYRSGGPNGLSVLLGFVIIPR
jgi:hypothetical protein